MYWLYMFIGTGTYTGTGTGRTVFLGTNLSAHNRKRKRTLHQSSNSGKRVCVYIFEFVSASQTSGSEVYLSVLLCRQSVLYRRLLCCAPTVCRARTCSSVPWGLFERWPEEQTNNGNTVNNNHSNIKRSKNDLHKLLLNPHTAIKVISWLIQICAQRTGICFFTQ